MREKKGLTRLDLARKIIFLNKFENINTEEGVVEEIEGQELGLRNLSLRQLGLIAPALGCSVDELVESNKKASHKARI